MKLDEATDMKCKFNQTRGCINQTLFFKWKDDKKETAWLTLGICPNCPIYKEDIDSGETEE